MLNLMEIMQGVRTGTLDAKKEVWKMLGNMTPAQREVIKKSLPQIENIARQAGVSTENFNQEINAHL